MALNKDTLKAAISGRLDTLFADPESPPAQIDVWDAIAEEIVDHIVTALEVKGITVDAGTPINTVVAAGVPIPQDGGVGLQTTMLAAATPAVKGIQDNDGTGRVA